MAQINVNDLKTGTTFQLDNTPFRVLHYSHTKMGRGNATIKVKAQNLKTRDIIEKSFISGSSVTAITTQKRPLQYLYQENENFVFMDPDTFDQYTLDKTVIGSPAAFLKAGQTVDVLFWQSPQEDETLTPLSLDLPPKLTFTVTDAPPATRGNSATNLFKTVKLENGLQVKAPLFIKTGDKVRIDTRTGEYVERAK